MWDVARSVARAFAVPDRWIGWSWKVSRMTAAELGDPDVIVSSGPPHSAHLAARSLSRRLGIPFAVDLRDDWAGNPLFGSRAPWRDPIDHRLERRTLKHASAVVVVSDASKRAYTERYPGLEPRLHVIANGFDPDDMPASAAPRTRSANGTSSFLHAGSMRYDRAGGDLLFEAFGEAARADPRLVLHLLGSVSPTNADRAKAAIPANNLSIDGFVPHDEAIRRMSEADVLVVISSATEAGAGTMTGKIFECLAVGRPVLLISAPGPGTELVERSEAGVVADPRVPGAVRVAIDRAAELAKTDGFTGASPTVVAEFDRGKQAETWSAILTEAIQGSAKAGDREER
jgi:glycosyltransferase involved in cell wall biosynthesis